MILIAIGILVVLIAVPVIGYAMPSSQIFGRVYYRGKTDKKVVALSFDDGPNEPYTSQVLDILDSYGIKGTFFAVGENVALYPEVARRIVAGGHILGNHATGHDANHALSHRGEQQIAAAQDIIRSVTGVSPHLYRPPHGKKSPWELAYLKSHNMVAVNWSLATNDQHAFLNFGRPTPEGFAAAIVKNAGPGKIILMHDGYGLNHDDALSDKSLTCKALPLIIKELKSEGYTFKTIPEILGVPSYN
jgi:peptidoglycan/xylan/chitin deacetylase (PgdA/CDA1 family)